MRNYFFSKHLFETTHQWNIEALSIFIKVSKIRNEIEIRLIFSFFSHGTIAHSGLS